MEVRILLRIRSEAQDNSLRPREIAPTLSEIDPFACSIGGPKSTNISAIRTKSRRRYKLGSSSLFELPIATLGVWRDHHYQALTY